MDRHIPHFLGPKALDRWAVERWSSFLAQDGRWRLWCRQHVGYEGIREDMCSYLVFAPTLEDVARELLRRPRILAECIPFPDFAGMAYHDFVARHPEELEEEEDYRGFSCCDQQSRFMAAIEQEPPETILEVLCEHNTDDDAEGNFCQLVELSLANFPDIALCQRLARGRRVGLARTLSKVRCLRGGAALTVASMLYPDSPGVLLSILLEEGLQLWQICASSAFCEAQSVFLASRTRGAAWRRFLAEESLAEVCEPIASSTKLLPERDERVRLLQGMTNSDISCVFEVMYHKGDFRTLSCQPVRAERVLGCSWQQWRRQPSVLDLLMRNART